MWLKIKRIEQMGILISALFLLTKETSMQHDGTKNSKQELQHLTTSDRLSVRHGKVTLSKWPSLNYSLLWSLHVRRKKVESILFHITVDSNVNWVGFGFSSPERELGDDWFIAWKDSKHRVHFKDCNTMHGGLHFDQSQDYHVLSHRRPKTLNLKVRRALKTYDDDDVKIKVGHLQLVWAFGKANKFSRIRSHIELVQEEKDVVFITSATQKESKNDLENFNKMGEPHVSTKQRSGSDGDTNLGPTGVDDSHKAEKYIDTKKRLKNIKEVKEGGIVLKKNLAGKLNTSLLTTMKYINCTVVLPESQNWYNLVKLKERGIYYAIIGSSAIMTGIIVIAFACFCSRKSPRSAASKMAYYKVDDDDEDQVEFLKERA